MTSKERLFNTLLDIVFALECRREDLQLAQKDLSMFEYFEAKKGINKAIQELDSVAFMLGDFEIETDPVEIPFDEDGNYGK